MLNEKNSEISLYARLYAFRGNVNIQYSENCKQINTVKPANSWNEHLENLVSIQHLHWKRNTFSFRDR